MDVKTKKRSTFYSPAEIRTGDSTWEQGVRSVKFAYPDKNGNVSRMSPELPFPVVLEMLEVGLEQGDIKAKDVVAVLARAMK